MHKYFEQWGAEKIHLDTHASRLYFHEREVWWCHMGVNIGFEQDGKGERFARPVLVFKKFNNAVFWAIPVSTKIKQGKFYSPLSMPDGMPRCVILSQLRLMDAKRLIDKVGIAGKENYGEIQKAVMRLCDE